MNFLPSGLFGNLLSFSFLKRRNDRYKFDWSTLHGATRFNNYASDIEKLTVVLANPAVLKVFAIQCDLFSRAKVMVKTMDGKELPDDPFIKRLRNPNPFQSQSQFLWDFMFFNMLGNVYCYIDSKVVQNDKNKMYFLTPHKMQWPRELVNNADKLILSDKTVGDLSNQSIVYKYNNGGTFTFKITNLIAVTDLTNGLGNWFKGPSRIDALYKVISNSEHALDSKNINVRFVGKFLVGSQSDVNKTPMSDPEKEDIENKVDDGDKRVFAIRSQVNIRRFVENLSQQGLGDAYLEDYYLIGSMYGIPRDVLEAYQSSTYENQEKARGSHVAYCLEPKGEQFMDAFEKYFGYTDKNICLSWDHLSFTQVFEEQKQKVKTLQLAALEKMLKLGIDIDEANEFLGTKFTINETEPATAPQSGQGENGAGD